ncbi:PID-CTERM protein-sorting domain-containing protein [Hyunsoonleella sp. 2307UL5-6]|uniref:PID-CTERM protein-sorting domain-containing protein n=1 Tax=Hyunsoonleella sp. 2307UL5-6 TaxID=3384768 RepID=UPI0039BCE58F
MMIQNKRTLASILFILISFVCIAQGGGNIPPPPQPPPPVGLPIDGGIFIGLLVAVFYGGKKLMKK